MRKLLIIILFCSLGILPAAAQQAQKPAYTKLVYFDFNKYDIRPSEDRTLTSFLRAIQAQATYSIKLTGHTDAVDNDQYNMQLGLNRSKAIKKYLVDKGVPEENIIISTKGEKVAVAENTTDTGRAQNRRVVMELYSSGLADKNNTTTTTVKKDAPMLAVRLYDAATKEPLKGEASLRIVNPKQLDNNKQRQYKEIEAFAQEVIKGRVYVLHATADGYRAAGDTIVIAADDKNNSFERAVYLDKLNIKRRLTYEKIYFEPNKDVFLTTAHDDLQELLAFMEGDLNLNVEIRGHINYTLNRPPMSAFEEYLFYDLSLRRAIAVYNYLVHFGIKKERMSYRGMSNKEMVLPYARTLEESMKNMRVEVLVLAD